MEDLQRNFKLIQFLVKVHFVFKTSQVEGKWPFNLDL